MDWQWIANGAFAIAAFFGGVWFNRISKDVDDLTEKVGKVELLVVGDYVKKDEFQKTSDKLLDKMEQICNKLDRKADRTHG